jgi:hypothetical protein
LISQISTEVAIHSLPGWLSPLPVARRSRTNGPRRHAAPILEPHAQPMARPGVDIGVDAVRRRYRRVLDQRAVHLDLVDFFSFARPS